MSYCVVCVCLRKMMSNILSYHMSLHSKFRVVVSAAISALKQCLGRLYLELFFNYANVLVSNTY